MKILQIIQRPQLRGAEIFACQLALEFTSRSLHVDVLYLFTHDNFALYFKLNFISLDANQSAKFWDVKAYRKLNKIIRTGKYDVVQANAADTLKYAVMSKLLFRWKAKLVFRNASLMGRLMHNALQRTYNRWLLSNCDSIVSVSENCRQDLIRFFPKAKNFSVTIPIGTYDFDSVLPATKEVSDEPIFIHVGGFVWEKNHTFLLEIFGHYFHLHNKGYLWLVGEGKLKASNEAKVREMGLQERVIFWGSRQDVIPLLKSADLLLMPSVVEGLPGVILEALSCGVPVLASNAGGISEVIEHNVNGFCLSELKQEDYVKCMELLTTDTSIKLQFVQAGKQLIKNVYKMSLIADRFLEFYGQVINEEARVR